VRRLVHKRLVIALIGGLVAHLLYKAYLYRYDREQYEDGNLLVTTASICLAGGVIYLALWLWSRRRRTQ
jgi:hypothetical protein